ncbi:MAG: hypothetical protein ACRDRW_19325 [Pseudonocardiaceae bacterium]
MPPEVATQRDIPPPAQMATDPTTTRFDHQLAVWGMQASTIGQQPQMSMGTRSPRAIHRTRHGAHHDHYASTAIGLQLRHRGPKLVRSAIDDSVVDTLAAVTADGWKYA